jgi:hypothetical protein
MNKYFFRHSGNGSIRRITICGFRPENSNEIYLGLSVCHPKYDVFTKSSGRRLSKRRAKYAFNIRNNNVKDMTPWANLVIPIQVEETAVPGAVFAQRAGEIIVLALEHFRKVDNKNLQLTTEKIERKLEHFKQLLSSIKNSQAKLSRI